MQVSEDCPVAAKLIETVEFEHVHYYTVVQALIKTLVLHKSDFLKAVAYVTGNATDMQKLFKDSLSDILSNCIDMTCGGCITAVLDERWCCLCTEVDRLCAVTKMATPHSYALISETTLSTRGLKAQDYLRNRM